MQTNWTIDKPKRVQNTSETRKELERILIEAHEKGEIYKLNFYVDDQPSCTTGYALHMFNVSASIAEELTMAELCQTLGMNDSTQAQSDLDRAIQLNDNPTSIENTEPNYPAARKVLLTAMADHAVQGDQNEE